MSQRVKSGCLWRGAGYGSEGSVAFHLKTVCTLSVERGRENYT